VTGRIISIRGPLPAPVEELAFSMRRPEATDEVMSVLFSAQIIEPVSVDEATAERMVRPYSWLLRRVGAAGLRLTAAGFLPPAHVAAACADLGIADDWIGARNRENQTLPVLQLRESATRLGLLRKNRGQLQATARGRKLIDDPNGLWWHLAGNLPPARARRVQVHASVLLLTAVAAGIDAPLEFAARLLDEAGWGNYDGSPITSWQARDCAGDLYGVLRLLGGFEDGLELMRTGPERATPDGALFARAALQTWPKERPVAE
jgi:hypothetical protein